MILGLHRLISFEKNGFFWESFTIAHPLRVVWVGEKKNVFLITLIHHPVLFASALFIFISSEYGHLVFFPISKRIDKCFYLVILFGLVFPASGLFLTIFYKYNYFLVIYLGLLSR